MGGTTDGALRVLRVPPALSGLGLQKKVITISRQYSSGGGKIAGLICSTNGYQFFDKNILAAAEVGLSDQEIIDFSEESYQARSFFERLLHRSQPVAQVSSWVEDETGVRAREVVDFSKQGALLLVQKAVEAAWRAGQIVIVGRAGQVILKDHPDELHIRVEAPLEDRLIQVCRDPLLAERSFRNSVDARRAAQNILETRDAASAGYLKRFYGVDWFGSSLYHLVINTGRLNIDHAARVILAAAQVLQVQEA
jgi:CMP/dCMP kinase